nr:hypothetical protein [Candidatus Enterousia merdequi]
MKQLTILFLLLLGCSTQNPSIIEDQNCHGIDCIKWNKKQQTVQYYEQILDRVKLDNNYKTDSLTYDQIDAMLYLSYIYLTDGQFKDIEKANKLLTTAKKAMWQDCDGYHGHYDNFCYFQYYQDGIPTFVNNLQDAIIIYQMSLPCVYIDMIQENEKAIDIIDGYFGSSRDVSIPALCDTFNPYKIVNIDDITTLKSYTYLENLNKEPETEGTIRFGFQRTRYHDFVYMLMYPANYFKTDNFKDLHVQQYDMDTDKKTKFFAHQLEQEIYKHPDLKQEYKKMIISLEQYYISSLGMNSKDAANYARMTASMIILQDIFIR